MKGVVHSIESLAAVDGEGLRCCVFLSGCPLRCVYCHNPDTWEKEGKEYTPEDLVRKIARYRPYFGKNGGVTFSGGEPLLQGAFLRSLIPLLEREGIGYMLDTSGQVSLSEDVCFLLENAQGVLLDLKFWDDASYRSYTGQGVQKTLAMLNYLEEKKVKTYLRTVIVPGINDDAEKLSRYAELVRGLECIAGYELLPFHTMGFFKYEKLGIKNPLFDVGAMDVSDCKMLQKILDEIRKNG